MRFTKVVSVGLLLASSSFAVWNDVTVTGPAVQSNIVIFVSSAGNQIKDSGVALSDLIGVMDTYVQRGVTNDMELGSITNATDFVTAGGDSLSGSVQNGANDSDLSVTATTNASYGASTSGSAYARMHSSTGEGTYTATLESKTGTTNSWIQIRPAYIWGLVNIGGSTESEFKFSATTNFIHGLPLDVENATAGTHALNRNTADSIYQKLDGSNDNTNNTTAAELAAAIATASGTLDRGDFNYPMNEAVARNKIHLWIFGGQSLMECNYQNSPGNTLSVLPSELQIYQTNAMYWGYIYQSGLNVSNGYVYPIATAWGPEIVFADEMLRSRYKVAIAKAAYGGTGLDDWLGTGNLFPYQYLTNKVITAMSDLASAGYEIDGYTLIWDSGQTDASTTLGQSFEANFLTLYSNILSDCSIDASDMEVYICGLNDQASGVTNRTYWTDVDTAQQTLCIEHKNFHYVNQDGIAVNSTDNIHCTPAGMIDYTHNILDAVYSNMPAMTVHGKLVADEYGQIASPPTKGLVAYYDFGTTNDITANGDDLEKYAPSLDVLTNITGRGSVVRLEDNPTPGGWNYRNTLPYSTDFTLSLWIDADTVQTETAVAWIAYRDTEWRIWFDTANDLVKFRTYNSSAAQTEINFAQALEGFKGVLTFSYGTAGQYIYLNGKQVAYAANNGTLDDNSTASTYFFSSASNADQGIEGYGDQLYIYNAQLSAQDVLDLARAQLRNEEPSLSYRATDLGLGTAAYSNSTAFATAAQGSTADTALQSADIDTLAELNAIVADATLADSSGYGTAVTNDTTDFLLSSTGLDFTNTFYTTGPTGSGVITNVQTGINGQIITWTTNGVSL